MRHKSRTILAALAAVLALGAVASASASAALPEFAPGSGEKLPITFEGLSSTAKGQFENSSGAGWLGYCDGAKTTGDITGAKALSLTIELKDCLSGSGNGDSCHSVGAESEDEVLSGSASLVYISKTEKRVGILFTPSPIEVICGTLETNVRGSLIIPVTPINTKTSKVDFTIRTKALGKQEFTSYENEKGEVKKAQLELNVGAGYTAGGLEIAPELGLTTSKPLTISG